MLTPFQMSGKDTTKSRMGNTDLSHLIQSLSDHCTMLQFWRVCGVRDLPLIPAYIEGPCSQYGVI